MNCQDCAQLGEFELCDYHDFVESREEARAQLHEAQLNR